VRAAGAIAALASLAMGVVTAIPASASSQIVIGFSQSRIVGSDWYKTLVYGAQQEAKKLGVKLIVYDANGDSATQNTQVDTLITESVNAIIVNPHDPIGLAQSIHKAVAAHIPVIAVNAALSPALQKLTWGYVVEDQIATGARGGYLAAPEVARRNPSLVGKTALAFAIGGYEGDVLTETRFQGWKQGYDAWLAQHPGKGVTLKWLPLRYGSWLSQDAFPIVRDVATANPDLKVVYSESDVMQAGIYQGLTDAGIWNKITEGAYDGYETTAQYMMQHPNGPIVSLTTNEPFKQGESAVLAAWRAVNHQKPEGVVYVKTVAFNSQNASKFYKKNTPGGSLVYTPEPPGAVLASNHRPSLASMLAQCNVGYCSGL
jgi:ribose transport system substrate-binding protein